MVTDCFLMLCVLIKTYVAGTCLKRNICFHGEIYIFLIFP